MKKTPLILAVTSLLASLSFLRAEGSLFISDGVFSLTIVDGSAADKSALPGVVSYTGTLDPASPWTVNITTGITKPVFGSATTPFMDLNSLNVSSSGGGNLTIEFSDNGFGPLTAGTFTSEIGGTTGGSVSFRTWADAGNALFAKTTPLASFTFGLSPFSGSVISDSPTTSPFSLTLQATITHSGTELTSFDGSIFDTSIRPNVPEPSTISLLTVGLVGGLWMANRARKKSAI